MLGMKSKSRMCFTNNQFFDIILIQNELLPKHMWYGTDKTQQN